MQMLIRWMTLYVCFSCPTVFSLWACHLQLESLVLGCWEHPLLVFCVGESHRTCSLEDFACVLLAPGLVFMSVIYSEPIFMCGVGGGFIFILLTVDIRWLQSCVERPIFLPWNFLAPFSKINLTINSRVYLWINFFAH